MNFAINDVMGLAMSLDVLAWTAAAEWDRHRAARLLGASARQAHANGGNPYETGMFLPLREQCLTAIRAALGATATMPNSPGATTSLSRTPSATRSMILDGQTQGSNAAELTRREGEVAELVARGLTNKQIATQVQCPSAPPKATSKHLDRLAP